MSENNLTTLTVSDISRGLAARAFSAVEISTAFQKAIKADTHNAFITVNERALENARAADKRLADGTADFLTGVPLAVKDVFVTEGLRTTAGSKILENYIPPYTAEAVKRLEERGMVVLGKTNCDEFAMGSSNEHSAYGPVTNPYDTTRVSGGSSGGSAVAVAAELSPTALGTDTGGSVRQPAAFCGVIGLKPTYGRISRYGVIAMASSLDHVGLFSKTARDAALLLEVLAGRDEHDMTSSTTPVPRYSDLLDTKREKLTIGLPKEFFSDHADPDMARAVEAAVENIKNLPNVTLKEISLPHARFALAAYYVLMPSEVSANLARFDGLRYGFSADGETLLDRYEATRAEGFGTEAKRRILLGTFTLSAGYADAYYRRASKVRRKITQDYVAAFRDVDLILSPTTPTPAFAVGEKEADPLTMYLSDIYTISANLAGVPACSFPIGTVRGLPVGLQAIGPWWSEGILLKLIDEYERSYPGGGNGAA